MLCSGLEAPLLLVVGAFFCFFALGGVLESPDPSPNDTSEGTPSSSSSLSGLARFFKAVDFSANVVCVIFFVAGFDAFGAGVFLGTVFALLFCKTLAAVQLTSHDVPLTTYRHSNGGEVIGITIVVEHRVFHDGVVHGYFRRGASRSWARMGMRRVRSAKSEPSEFH
jgi:hypothetical protein